MTCPVLKQNEGRIDRVIRVVVGFVALYLGHSMLGGIAQIIAYAVGAIAMITGVVGFCGLYQLLGITTKETVKK